MRKCEECGQRPLTTALYAMHDYCEDCLADLCPACMVEAKCVESADEKHHAHAEAQP